MDRLSILVANRNTLPFLRLCIRSLRENLSRKDHHILVLDDASSDGSAEWLQESRSRCGLEVEFHKGPQRLGIVGAYNRLVDAAETAAVFLVHTDMYFAPGADVETARHLAPATVCTCTRIEPPLYPGAPHKIVTDLGTEPDEFREEEFLAVAAAKARPGEYTEGIFAPMMCYKEDFLAIGGLDPAFAPQSREDSDLFARMAAAGYRFRQSWSAFCYHFSGRASRKKDGIEVDSDEWQVSNRKNERNFVRRWGASVRHDEFLKPILPPAERISLVALLGNEPDNVLPFLDNLEPYFEEIILIADGPQAESVRMIDEYVSREEAAGPTLLEREKIKVVERPLDGDFSAQRNFGQGHATCDWVLHADLDERFDRGLLESLRDIAIQMRRTDKTACGFPRLNYLDGVLVNDLPRDQWTPEGLAAARGKEETQVGNPDPQFRLLKREVRWRGKVHETPEPVGRSHEQVMFWAHAVIRHPKALSRQREQDERYEAIAAGKPLPALALAAGPKGGRLILESHEVVKDGSKPHLGGNYLGGDPLTFTPELWKWLVERLKIRSVLDVGCGTGEALREFAALGCSVVGLEGLDENVKACAPYPVIVHDLTEGPFRLSPVDLVWASELVEHVEEQYVPNLLGTFKSGKYVAITHAEPGEDGYHHVNCQPAEYWIERFKEAGFSYLPELTQEARDQVPDASMHFKRSGLIFRNNDV